MVERFRDWYLDLLTNAACFMLVIQSRERCPIESVGWFIVIIANARKLSRQRPPLLLRLLTHCNILSRDVQFALGRDNWTWDMFDYLPHIDLQKPESIGDHFSSYLGVTYTPDKDGNLTDLYNGSATCVLPNEGLVGEAARMISGHRRTLEFGYDGICRRRRDHNIENHKELFIHEKMAFPGAKYFFITAAHYPIISSQCLRNKAKVLTVFAESLVMILLGTICKGNKQLPRRASLKQMAMMVQDISAQLRPQGIPQPQWGGTNKLRPTFQSSRPVWDLLIDTDAAVGKTA